MKCQIFSLVLFLLFTGCNNNRDKVPESINKIKDEQIFNNSDLIDIIKKTFGINKAEILGKLETTSKQKLMLIKGEITKGTYYDLSMYLFPIPNFINYDSLYRLKYTYPGKTYYYIDNELVSDHRVFYGYCTDKYKNSIIWYQKDLQDDNTWKTSFYVVELLENSLEEKSLSIKDISLEEILKNIKSGKCNEIQGIDHGLEP